MSTPAPAVAPWEIGFELRTVQFVPLAAISFTTKRATVSEGQWWRIVSIQAGMNLSAVAGNRQLRLTVLDATGSQGYQMFAAGVAPASAVYSTTWGPRLTAYTQAGFVPQVEAVQTIPDVIWPPGSTFELQMLNGQAGDAYHSNTSVLCEIYTPRKRELVTPLPTPLLV